MTQAARRVLMLVHHFPPAGGSGANRALAFARYLPMYGWRPTVVTPRVEWAANRDDELLRELPRELRVVRTRSLEPRPRRTAAGAGGPTTQRPKPNVLKAQLGHLKRFPDAHVGWLPFAVDAGRRERADVLYSTSGPFTSHVAGLLLKRLTHRPWVAELRDGWYRWNRAIFADYPAWRDTLESRLEAAAIRSADRVVLVTERMADAFRSQYADLPREHFATVSNGFDPAQFVQTEPAVVPTRVGWHVVHAGALYYGRSLGTLLEAARRVAAADPDFARAFRLRLIGTLDGVACAEVERSGMARAVEVLDHTGHAEALAAMRAADALLLVANTTPGAEATVPGKLFEYLAVGRPVLAVAPKQSATADILHQTGGGWLGVADDVDSIACALRQAFAQRDHPSGMGGIEQFDRRRLTGELARLFDEVTAGAARRL